MSTDWKSVAVERANTIKKLEQRIYYLEDAIRRMSRSGTDREKALRDALKNLFEADYSDTDF